VAHAWFSASIVAEALHATPTTTARSTRHSQADMPTAFAREMKKKAVAGFDQPKHQAFPIACVRQSRRCH
jgi:hypothetical protein